MALSFVVHGLFVLGLGHVAYLDSVPMKWEVFAASDSTAVALPLPSAVPATSPGSRRAPKIIGPRSAPPQEIALPKRDAPASSVVLRADRQGVAATTLVIGTERRPDASEAATPLAAPALPDDVSAAQVGRQSPPAGATAQPLPHVDDLSWPVLADRLQPVAEAPIAAVAAASQAPAGKPILPPQPDALAIAVPSSPREPMLGTRSASPVAAPPAASSLPTTEFAATTPPAPVEPLASPTEVPLLPATTASSAERPPVLEPRGASESGLSRPAPTTPADRPAAAMTASPSIAAEPRAVPSAGGSALGLGLGRLRIRLDRPSVRTTDQPTDVVSGSIVGRRPLQRIAVRVEHRLIETMLDGRAFRASVDLSPGVNRVHVVATDDEGVEIEEVVTIRYLGRSGPDLAISSPRDGQTLTADDPPFLVVQGQVSDVRASTVWLVANEQRVAVPVKDGRFRYILPVLAPTLRVHAKMDGDDRASDTVTVHAAAALPPVAVLLTDWPRESAGRAQMTVTWRPNPSSLEQRAQALPLRGPIADGGEVGPELFYLRHAQPGVYTFSLSAHGVGPLTVRPVLYLAADGAARPLPPVALGPSGRSVVARLLLPHGVLWEQDEWFTGRSASGDTITKFRFPDGVSWVERLRGIGQ